MAETSPELWKFNELEAEIERLQAALDASADYGDRQIAEIERLRAALQAILDETTVSDEAEHLRHIAAAALTGGKE